MGISSKGKCRGGFLSFHQSSFLPPPSSHKEGTEPSVQSR